MQRLAWIVWFSETFWWEWGEKPDPTLELQLFRLVSAFWLLCILLCTDLNSYHHLGLVLTGVKFMKSCIGQLCCLNSHRLHINITSAQQYQPLPTSTKIYLISGSTSGASEHDRRSNSLQRGFGSGSSSHLVQRFNFILFCARTDISTTTKLCWVWRRK